MAARRYVMIGAPITKVRSPALLEERFATFGIRASVVAQHLEPGELDAFMQAARADPTLDGLLVTMPHKKAVMGYLDRLAPIAQRVGSVNTVRRTPSGGFEGTQFDGPALVNALLAKGVALHDARVLLLGTGGAGLAIAEALAAHGCAALAVDDRDARLVRSTLNTLRDDPACLTQPTRRARTGEYDLLINATPVGMASGDPSPFAPALVALARCVADIVADPGETRLEALARDAGALFVSGRDMVKGQIAPICDWLREVGSQAPAGRQDEPR